MCGFFLGGELWHRPPPFLSFFTYTRPNQSRVGAIDKPDRPEQAFDQYDITEDPERIFTNDFSIVDHEKMIFLVFLMIL